MRRACETAPASVGPLDGSATVFRGLVVWSGAGRCWLRPCMCSLRRGLPSSRPGQARRHDRGDCEASIVAGGGRVLEVVGAGWFFSEMLSGAACGHSCWRPGTSTASGAEGGCVLRHLCGGQAGRMGHPGHAKRPDRCQQREDCDARSRRRGAEKHNCSPGCIRRVVRWTRLGAGVSTTRSLLTARLATELLCLGAGSGA